MFINAFILTDLTDSSSFDKAKYWVGQLKSAEPVSSKLKKLDSIFKTFLLLVSLVIVDTTAVYLFEIYVMVQFYTWFKFYFLLFHMHYHIITIHYHTWKQKSTKFEPRIKLNHNIYQFTWKIFTHNCNMQNVR